MSKKMPSNNQNEVNISDMINRVNRGGNNISQEDIQNMAALEKLSKPIQSHKMSTVKKMMIGLVSIAAIAALPITVLTFKKEIKAYVTTTIDYNIAELDDVQINSKKGSKVEDLQIMQVEGYRFEGWYVDKNHTIRLSPSDQLYNTTIYAKYIREYKVSTIIDGNTYVHKLVEGSTISDIAIDNKLPDKRFDGWYSENVYEDIYKIDDTTKIDKNQTIYGRYIQQIQIEVYVDGNFKLELIKDKGVTLQEFENEIQQPNKQYKIFQGWYKDLACENPLGENEQIDADEIIYGRYVAEQVKINVNIDGTLIDPAMADKGLTFGEFKRSLQVQNKQYYDFYGWYTTDACNVQMADSTILLNEITIYGKYVLQEATITLKVDGEVSRAVTVNKTTTINSIDLANLGLGERDGYRFDGWYKNSARTEPWNNDGIFTSNITLYGKYIKQINIKIYVDGQEKNTLTKDIGITLTQLEAELEQPDKPYMTFDGWYEDSSYNNKVIDYEQITEDVPLYGRYVNIKITISFNIDNSAFGESVSVNQGSTYGSIKLSLPVPTKQYHKFDGWYTTDDYETKVDDSTVLLEDLTIYGKFILKKSTITLKIEGEDPIDINVNQSTKITDIDLENYNLGNRDGYRFSGWYIDDGYTTPWSNSTKFEQDSYTLHGKYAEILGIALIVENTTTGEINSEDYEYNPGDNVEDLPVMDKPNQTDTWEFDGWYKDSAYSEKFEDSIPLEKGKSYYAKFIQKLSVTMVVDGEISSTSVTYGDTISTLDDMSKSGYEFDGWYENSEYTGDTINDDFAFTDNCTIYGRYKPEITLVINGNENKILVISGTTLDENNDQWTNLVNNVTNYRFAGWFSDSEYNTEWTESTVLTIPTTIYAKMVEQITVQIYLNGSPIDQKTIDKNTLFKDVKDTIKNFIIPTGYEFNNWYTDNTYSTVWNDNDEIDGTYNIYGLYTIMEFTVTVSIDGEEQEPPL